jgi:PAS domain S-box-containing protein
MGEALVAVDASGQVTDFNAAAAELFGRPASEVRGAKADRLVMISGSGERLGERLASPGPAWAMEATVTTADGAPVPVAVTAAPLRGAAGEVAGTVIVLRDMRRERELDRMKTEFLSNISHEMKTPLTPIKGYAQMLATRDITPAKARAFAGEIVVGARQLERVITQLVNFATMAAGRLEPEPEPVSARRVLDDAVARWSGNGHVIARRVARGTPDLLVDRRLLDLSLDELLDNAVKYSPEGGKVSVVAEPAPRRNGAGPSVLVSVTDRGVGIPDDRLDDIFAEFAQGDGSSTRTFGGLGLGLPLVRHVAFAHGGDLTCESTPGRGSTFTLRMPAAERS